MAKVDLHKVTNKGPQIMKDDVIDDLARLRVGNWRNKAIDRTK